jgi:hypothetical protein
MKYKMKLKAEFKMDVEANTDLEALEKVRRFFEYLDKLPNERKDVKNIKKDFEILCKKIEVEE